MASKRGSLEKQTPRRKSASVSPRLADGAAAAALQSAQTTPARATATGVDAEVRRQMIATEAYYLAERRGFAPGYEVLDWLAAEAVVDTRLADMSRDELAAKHIVQ